MITAEDENTAKKANKAIKELGYKSSWGIKSQAEEITDNGEE